MAKKVVTTSNPYDLEAHVAECRYEFFTSEAGKLAHAAIVTR